MGPVMEAELGGHIHVCKTNKSRKRFQVMRAVLAGVHLPAPGAHAPRVAGPAPAE